MEKKKTILTIVLLVLAYFSYLGGMILTDVLLVSRLPKAWTKDSGFCETLGCLVLLVIYGFWYGRIKKKGEESKEKMAWWKQAVCVVVIALGVGAISNGWLLAVDSFLYKIPFIGKSYSSMQSAFSDMESGNFLFTLLNVAIIGPIVEELLFRGIIYRYLEKISKNVLIPILVSGLLFGIWHGIFVQSVYTAVFGVVLGMVVYQTGNLSWVIAIHIINNLLSVLSSISQWEGICGMIEKGSYCLIIPMGILLYRRNRKKYSLFKAKNDIYNY